MCLSCTCTHRLRCPRRWRRHMEPGVWSLFANIYLWERYHTTSYKNLGAIGRHRLAKIELEAAQGRCQVPGQSHKFRQVCDIVHNDPCNSEQGPCFSWLWIHNSFDGILLWPWSCGLVISNSLLVDCVRLVEDDLHLLLIAVDAV